MNPALESDATALRRILCQERITGLPKQKPNILLIEDEFLLQESLHDLLGGCGYELHTAPKGKDAIAQLAEKSIDLVLLELCLPGISGEVFDFINANRIDSYVIVLSGNADIDTAIASLKRGAYDYLRKPYSLDELLKTTRQALKDRFLAQESRIIARQLESSERLYRCMVESSPDMLFSLNLQGYITFINERVTELLGYTKSDLLGRHYSFLVYEEDLERARYAFQERRTAERASRNIELRLKCLQGQGGSGPFGPRVKTVSFSSVGVYSCDNQKSRKCIGTYGVARDVTDLKRAEELLYHQAYHDILTGLPNRVLFQDRLELAMKQAERNNTELAVMFVDLDRFKFVNDSLGHVKGDLLLVQVADRLKHCLRKGDTLARHGGDEFTLVLPDIKSNHDPEQVAHKILMALQQPFHLDGDKVNLSASIGIAIFPLHGCTCEQLVRHADIAMYGVKRNGKDGFLFFVEAMIEHVQEKLLLERGLYNGFESTCR